MEDKITFEEAIKELEQIVVALEKGDAPLEESLGFFERGVALTKFCMASLDKAEQKVMLLTKDKATGKVSGSEPMPEEE